MGTLLRALGALFFIGSGALAQETEAEWMAEARAQLFVAEPASITAAVRAVEAACEASVTGRPCMARVVQSRNGVLPLSEEAELRFLELGCLSGHNGACFLLGNAIAPLRHGDSARPQIAILLNGCTEGSYFGCQHFFYGVAHDSSWIQIIQDGCDAGRQLDCVLSAMITAMNEPTRQHLEGAEIVGRACASNDGIACTLLAEELSDFVWYSAETLQEARTELYEEGCKLGEPTACGRLDAFYRAEGRDEDRARVQIAACVAGQDPWVCNEAARFAFQTHEDTGGIAFEDHLLELCLRGRADSCMNLERVLAVTPDGVALEELTNSPQLRERLIILAELFG